MTCRVAVERSTRRILTFVMKDILTKHDRQSIEGKGKGKAREDKGREAK